MAGLTAEGFEPKTLEEILNEVEGEEHADIDPTLDFSPEQPLAQVNGIGARKWAECWELLETFSNAMNPNGAENFLLDNVCAITGTKRRPKSRSRWTVNCTVTDGASFAAGQIQINIAGNTAVRFFNEGAVGPFSPAGVYPVVVISEEYGPVQGVAGTAVLTAPVSNLTSIATPLDAIPGELEEDDASLRLRREAERTAPGASTIDAIRADVLQVDGVKQCFVYENVLLDTDENGLPGKSIEVVIYDGTVPAADDDEIAQVIWQNKPCGCETVGGITVTIPDATGVHRTVKFSRATVVPVYLEFDLMVDASFFPRTGAALVQAAAAAYGDRVLNLGLDVFSVAFKAQALTVSGVLDVPALRLGFASSPTGTANLGITGRQIADVDTSRIVVNVTTGSP